MIPKKMNKKANLKWNRYDKCQVKRCQCEFIKIELLK
jgi:hypothetical protein